ncbi:flagellar protein FlgN [Halobacillus fulvus]|nr:flagellar protein FlgN [Halobacillus fulvus]
MTVQQVVQLMGQMKQLNESLLSLSHKKTEAIKTNDMNSLQQLLTMERKHVQAINKVEKERIEAVTRWYNEHEIPATDPTVSEMLTYLEGEEHQQLHNAYNELILVLSELKNQEQLNAELIQQSLQFVNVSLDMLEPSLEQVNYGHQPGVDAKSKRSVFDSKA